MATWSTYRRATLVYWAHFQHWHNRSRKNLEKRKIKDLVLSEAKLEAFIDALKTVLEAGDAPLKIPSLNPQALAKGLYGLTYLDAAKKFGAAVVAAEAKG